MQHLNRLGRRAIMCMLLIAVLVIVWNVLDA
jgi:predicted nucleic acid-binding Zn ribbon protein